MSKSKPALGDVGAPAGKKQVRIVVRPDNVALIRPPAGQLRPLAEYQSFLIDKTDTAAGDLDDAIDGPELSPSSAFPAGLLGRFQAALTAGGYQVTVDDRRRFEQGFRVNQELCQASYGAARAYLRAALAEPLGCVEYGLSPSWVALTEHLACLYPDARTLIIIDVNAAAAELYNNLWRTLGASLGLLAADRVGKKARCLVTTYRWLPLFKPGAWQVALPIIFNSRLLTESTYRAVVRLRAQRVYGLVPQGLRLGRATRLRLEAMSGVPLQDPGASADESPPGDFEPAG
jgi:hypothetical protein